MSRMESVKHVWSAWGLHVLVLLSFTLQVVLLVLAEFRRRANSGVLKAVVWSAYLLADTTAIYVLSHLSVTSRSPEHQLMVFWAPFLLLHLGGQDNITAYAIEDTRLWLHHLQALAVQGVEAAYVLYESSMVGSRSFLRRAAILMFVVGSLKYAERVWALWRAGGTSSGSSYRSLQHRKDFASICEELMNVGATGSSLIKRAHLLLDVPRDFLKGPLPKLNLLCQASRSSMVDLYKVTKVQLSLMQDVFYTKTEVIHGWFGLLMRAMSTVATAVALSLFHTDDKEGYNRVDVIVTHVLLVGALILETMWLLRAMFSSWTWVALEEYWNIDTWGRVQKLLASKSWRRRYWHRCMEQHDLLELCSRSRASRGSRVAEYFEVEDWWNMQSYSWSIPVPKSIEQLVAKQVDQSRSIESDANEDYIFNSRGRAALHKMGWYDGPNGLHWSIDIELDESILVWHIATKIYLCWRRNGNHHLDEEAKDLTETTVEALSNYMLFLLAGRPYMLPPPTSRNAYVELCYCLTHPELSYSSAEELASLLHSYGEALNAAVSHFEKLPSIDPGTATKKTICLHSNETLKKGSQLGAALISAQQGPPPADILELLAQVWVEMLCYAGHRCSGFYHAKQLSNGGELITIAAILAHYISKAVKEDEDDLVEDGRAKGSKTTISFATGDVVTHASEGITVRVEPIYMNP